MAVVFSSRPAIPNFRRSISTVDVVVAAVAAAAVAVAAITAKIAAADIAAVITITAKIAAAGIATVITITTSFRQTLRRHKKTAGYPAVSLFLHHEVLHPHQELSVMASQVHGLKKFQ